MAGKDQQTQKHKIKKFLNLLKNAQNVAFVKLVTNNLNAELHSQNQRPDKILKIVHFLNDNVLMCSDQVIKNREFARLKITEALGQMIANSNDNFQNVCAQIVHGLNINDPKWNNKIEKYSSIIYDVKLVKNETIFDVITIRDILSVSENKLSYINDLMSNHEFLLRDATLTRPSGEEENLTKEQLIKELGSLDQYSLSDFIDPKLIDFCIAPVKRVNIQAQQTKSLKKLELFINKIHNSNNNYFSGIFNQKKQKTELDSTEDKFLVLSPSLSILANFGANLTHDCWETRQVAACGISSLLSQMKPDEKLKYVIIDRDHKMRELELPITILLRNILTRCIILMLKDQWCDYEEININTPVRFQAMNLIQRVSELSQGSEDIQLLIQNLPQLLVVCQDDQEAKHSFFMIMKGLILEKNLKNQIFHMFGKDMLIQCILRVEDNVKIVVTEIISLFLEKYFEQENPYKYIDLILTNLAETLKLSDDIEGSVIFVFNLINQILNLADFNPSLSSFRIETAVFFPFNFHKVVKVRRTFSSLINKFLKIPKFFSPEQLVTLHTLTVQSLIMEEDEILFTIQSNNLRLIVKEILTEKGAINGYVKYLSTYLFMPERFQKWLYCYEMKVPDFQPFLFVESPCFDNLNQNYYKIVYEPINKEEKHAFYLKKLERCVEVMGIIAAHSGLQQYISQFLKMNAVQGVIGLNDVIEFLVYERIVKINQDSEETKDFMKSLDPGFTEWIAAGFSTKQSNIFDFKDLQRFQENIQNLSRRFQKRGLNNIEKLFTQVNDLIEEAKQKILSQTKPSDNIWLNLEKLEQTFNSAINLCKNLGSQSLEIAINEAQDSFRAFTINQAQITDRFRALVICQHLMSFICPGSKLTLHSKLNDVIHPIWNQIRTENELYYQKVFARVLSSDMLTALAKAKKLKPLDAVMGLVINGLGKLNRITTTEYEGLNYFVQDQMEEFPFLFTNEDADQKQILTELRGCELVLQDWVKMSGLKVFNVYQSTKLETFLSKCDNTQHFVNVAFKTIQNLLLHRGKEQNRQPHDQTQIFSTILSQLSQNFEFFNNKDIKFTSDLLVSLFYLFNLEGWDSLQLELMVILSEQMDNQSACAFTSLQFLLEQCLSSKQRQILEAEKSDKKTLTKIIADQSQGILKFLAFFLLPVIKNLQFSRDIFEGDEKHGMRILSLLIQLLPLCTPLKSNGVIDQKLQDGQDFLAVFTQSEIKTQDYQFLVKPNAELRTYQKEGIQWMAKLGKYGLNCALCDDMGLGKTIQSLTVVLNESMVKMEKDGVRRINMVICPNTLTYQWLKEIEKFFGHAKINAFVYDSTTSQKIMGAANANSLDVIITSYERARNDFNLLSQFNYFYIVLDEGHRIKNAKSKTTQSTKAFFAERKLVLTGTPLQNKVSELWSIFDFLMPNFLEDEKVFNQKYNQFLTSNLNKLSEKLEETQNFILALKSLKKRIAPFILRRTKTEVLKDLPPKVIQDFECEMTEVQKYAHEYVDKNYPIQQVTQGVQENGLAPIKTKGSQILQNLTLHRRVCNHPHLVVEHIQGDIGKMIQKSIKNDFVSQSGKMLGLIDLLRECEIIQSDNADLTGEDAPKQKGAKKQDQAFEGLLSLAADQDEEPNMKKHEETNGHRALIFCQMKSYLEMIIQHILIPFGIKYTELLSMHSGQQRFEIVEQFNTDPSISVMIMTTAVGGLGLNLTGADTVIFMEHDWNPMKDLQAIDRAHRIGQKRTVNVYRLILKETLEEKIMSLQTFKKNLAKNLIQSSRSDISIEDAENMQMHDLLSCFEEHTVYGQTTNKNDKKPKDPNVVGAENYEDKVVEEDVWEQDLEDM